LRFHGGLLILQFSHSDVTGHTSQSPPAAIICSPVLACAADQSALPI
jgi:hypothetical protein